MVFVFNEITYKSKKAFFYAMNPDRQHEKVTQNEVDMFMYHNNLAYHEHKKIYYRDKYRKNKSGNVRKYTKFDDKVFINTNQQMSNEEFQDTFFHTKTQN